MITYQYECYDCTKSDLDNKYCTWDFENSIDGFCVTGEYLFFKKCHIGDKEKNPVCPRCGGVNTGTSFIGCKFEGWVRGEGLVRDVAGARRDMNRYKVLNEDPYDAYRESGEKDYLAEKFRKGGLNLAKIGSRLAKSSQDAKKKVLEMEDVKLTDDQAKIILRIDVKECCSYDEFDDIDDVNSKLSSLIPEFVFKNRKGKFVLMARGRKIAESLLEL